jgi:LPXTG-site transpeptidase (sortase) family protein
MRFSSRFSKFICFVSVLALFLEMHAWVFAAPTTPQVPETAVSQSETADAQAPLPDPEQLVSQLTHGDDYPVELMVPSINLDVSIVNVGVNSKGEMDVPDGNTKAVGWYDHGTIPGDTGSAVLDAHVFAAFTNLRYAKVGDDIYVKTKSGNILHFRIEQSLVYKTAEVPVQTLFNRDDKPRLNLITCAGKLTKDRSTYDHRLVDYAVLVDE